MGYDKHRDYVAEKNRESSRSGRDIGKIPPVAVPARKKEGERDFKYFCEAYFPTRFNINWSHDHLKIISKIERAVLYGGLFAMAMPRGSGKTSLCECATAWALLYGHHDYAALIGSDEASGLELLDAIKAELENNDELYADFPEVCHPVRQLEGITHRCRGQLYKGKRTNIGWTAKELVLPTIPKSKASGGIVRVAGITGRIRGMKYTRPDGKSVRPSLVIIDDPQTDESARSASQSHTREAIVAGAILGLAGPKKKISGIMPCTVIQSGDMADSILDREKHPEWQGERTKMLEAFPTDLDRWDEYKEILVNSLINDGDGREATAFYKKHRKKMDAGAIVSWPDRYDEGELSAVQHAMNKFLLNQDAFFAEYQNEPKARRNDEPELSDDFIAAKQTALPAERVPQNSHLITAFVDVQKELLYYVVAAWEQNFTGHVIAYGAYPEQGSNYFTAATARRKLSDAKRGAGMEGSIYAGLEQVASALLGRSWIREDGTEMQVDRMLVDANWGQSTGVVYRFASNSPFSARILPAHGKYVGASSQPWSEYKPRRGEQIGHHWRLGPAQSSKVRRVVTDVNYWKSFVHDRLATPTGDHGSLTLHQGNHRMFAEQMNAEYRVQTEGRGRKVDEWKQRPERPDNHLFDCMVGCCVGASIHGLTLMGAGNVGQPAQKKRTYKSLSELRRKKKGR